MDKDETYENYDSGEEDATGEEFGGYADEALISESSDSESEQDDSGFSTNENGTGCQVLSLFDGPSVLVQPPDEDEGEYGE